MGRVWWLVGRVWWLEEAVTRGGGECGGDCCSGDEWFDLRFICQFIDSFHLFLGRQVILHILEICTSLMIY